MDNEKNEWWAESTSERKNESQNKNKHKNKHKRGTWNAHKDEWTSRLTWKQKRIQE